MRFGGVVMDDIYTQLIEIIGDPLPGTEIIIYIIACFIVLYLIYFMGKLFMYIFKFIGGIS